MMKKRYGLTNTEMELMEMFWETKKRLSFKEIMDYSVNVLKKNWKKQTVSTYLTNLQRAGLIEVDSSQTRYTYYALCTKEEHIHNWTKTLVKEAFGDSITNFFAAFTGGEKLSEEEADELKKML